MARLHEDTFLQQSQPDVAVLVFADGVHLRGAQIYFTAIVRVVYQSPVLWVVDAETHTVVAQHQVSAAVEIQYRDMSVSCTFYMYGRVTVQSEEATISGGYIDSAVITLTDV